jgi:hypothetical protein
MRRLSLSGAGSILKATMVRTTDCFAAEKHKTLESVLRSRRAQQIKQIVSQLYKSRQTEWSGAQQIVGCNATPSDRVERNTE